MKPGLAWHSGLAGSRDKDKDSHVRKQKLASGAKQAGTRPRGIATAQGTATAQDTLER